MQAVRESGLQIEGWQETKSTGWLRRVGRFIVRKPAGAFGAFVIAVTVVVAVIGPSIAPYNPQEQTFKQRFLSPSSSHPFGTDQAGRDIFSRVLVGARISVEVGLVAVGVATVLGLLTGVISGYYGGITDDVIQRWMDIQVSIPGIILAMVVLAILGGGLVKLMIVVGLFLMPGWSRVIRGSTLSLKEANFVEATRSLGATDGRLLVRHILPNVLNEVIVLASTGLSAAILTEAALSFLGLGVSVDTITWGGMLSRDARTYFERAWWMAVAPGVAISLVVLAFNLLGDALRDVWDPRLRGV